jgi:hypothetical protein
MKLVVDASTAIAFRSCRARECLPPVPHDADRVLSGGAVCESFSHGIV